MESKLGGISGWLRGEGEIKSRKDVTMMFKLNKLN